jgi:hypothetical protein
MPGTETVTVTIPVDYVTARRIAELERKLSQARGEANDQECDATFWRERCEKVEKERDAALARLEALQAAEAALACTP